MDQPTPALTEPTETGSDDAQQTGQADAAAAIYNPMKADRGPTRDEIEAWRQHTYDEMIETQLGPGVTAERGSLAEHHAATQSGRVYTDWSKIMDRVDSGEIDSGEDAATLCGRALMAAMTGQSFDAANAPLPSIVEAERERAREVAAAERAARQAAGEPEPPIEASGTDADGEAVEAELVELGVKYEEVRMAATDAGRQNKTYNGEKLRLEREILRLFVDSGQLSLSLIMPGSGENRVLSPMSKVWPKVRPDESLPVDDATGEHPLFAPDVRIAALRASGLGHLVEEKINDRALREQFEQYASAEDMPEALRRVYDVSHSWSLSSTKGRQGRVRPPSAAEIEQGKAPRATR